MLLLATVALAQEPKYRLTVEAPDKELRQLLVKLDYALTQRVSLRGQTGTTTGVGFFYRYSWD